MAGVLVVDPPERSRWDRFALSFDDGSRLVLRDKRRLGRAVLNPDLGRLGPDAAEVSRAEFRRRVGAGRAPVKARMLDQHAIAGVGNLLCDEALWRARIRPDRRTGALSEADLDRLRRELRAAVRAAIRHGGVHTGAFAAARGREGSCPRDGHHLERATIGGRTTYWCPVCQR
jgi:formamidopyrimidine-DNA glycosylase